jgi:hypothetical protein
VAALRVPVKRVEALGYKLRMFGVALDDPANLFCDTQSVLLNSTLPLSTLKKKLNYVNYHKVQGPFLHCCWHHCSCYEGAAP